MKSSKKPYKKNNQMLQNYKRSIKKSNVESEDTVMNDIINLESSDIPSEMKTDEMPVQGKSFNLKLRDWFVQNWIGVILIGAILLLLQWGVDAKVNISEIKTRLEYIDASIEKLDDSYSRKQEVKLEMENIKELINNNHGNFEEINGRLNKIEGIISNSIDLQ